MAPRLMVDVMRNQFLGVRDPGVGRPFVAQYSKDDDGRFNVIGWYFSPLLSPEPLTNEVFRSVSVTRIEALINRRDYARILGGNDPELLDRSIADASQVDKAIADFVVVLQLHENARRPRSSSLRLRIPETKRFPDEFYQRVADLYLELLERDEPPIVTLAEANDRPYKTVAAWIQEARRRGMLPPGRAGKAV